MQLRLLKKKISVVGNGNRRIARIPVYFANELLKGQHANIVRKAPAVLRLTEVKPQTQRKVKARPQNTFKDAINIADMFTRKNGYGQHILKTVLLSQAGRNRVNIKATDLGMSFDGTVEVQGIETGKPDQGICISAMALKKVCPQLNGATKLKLEENGIHINDYFIVKAEDCKAEDFPITSRETAWSCNIPDLGHKLAYVSKALVSKALVSKALGGSIHVNLRRGEFMVSDGRRIHLAPLPVHLKDVPKTTGKDIILSTDILKAAKLFNGRMGFVKDKKDYSVVVFDLNIPNCRAGYTLVEGHCVNYPEVIPSSHTGSLIIERLALSNILKRVMAVVSEEDRRMIFEWPGKTGDGAVITVNGNDGAPPAFSQALDNARCKGTPFRNGINAYYLHDAVANMPDELVEITVSTVDVAWVVKGKTSGYMAVIMPINIEGKEGKHA